jgi:fumarate reductase flavoprotein subunit
VWLNHAVTALAIDDTGAIAGASVRGPGGQLLDVAAQAVLLTCGGYAGDPAEFAARNGVPQYNASPWPFSRGVGLTLGESVGGYARGAENLFCNFGALFNTDDFPAKPVGRIEHFPERRQPWEIYVNAAGQRFVREDIDSVDAREMALFQQPDQRYWVVFDHRILTQAPPIVQDWTREQVRAAFNEAGPAFLTADTLAALADKAGIDANGLLKSVEGFNYGVQTGKDFFGRAHHPLPIGEGPFHAIRMQASSISSSIGLAVDDELRVIRRDGSPIANLYAAGEILGSSQTMGKAACGGMMVTPAMTFGRLLGDHLIPLDLGR